MEGVQKVQKLREEFTWAIKPIISNLYQHLMKWFVIIRRPNVYRVQNEQLCIDNQMGLATIFYRLNLKSEGPNPRSEGLLKS